MYILCSMKTVISVKVDEGVKEAAKEIAKSSGLSVSSLVNSYLKQVVATRRIEIFVPEQMTPKLEGLIAEVEKEREAGEPVGPFSTVDEFIADLEK